MVFRAQQESAEQERGLKPGRTALAKAWSGKEGGPLLTPWTRCTQSVHAGVQEGEDGPARGTSASPRWLNPFFFLQATLAAHWGPPSCPEHPLGHP